MTDFTSPRAWAFSLIGIHEYLRRMKGDRLAIDAREELTGRLMTIFDKVAGPGWTWFEDGLAYDNAKLAHALIVSGRATGQRSVYERGIQALRWLVGVQTSQHGQLRPIGSNGFYRRNGARADFDQQPIEAHTTISACLEAYRATPTRGGTNRRNAPSTGSSVGTILASNSTAPRPAAAAMGCTRTAATKTRERNRRWPFSCRWRKCGRYKTQRTAFNEPTWYPDHTMKPIDVKRSTVTLDPDRTHVLARPFRLMSDQRSTKISARVMALSESEVHTLLAGVRAEFGDRQLKIDEFLRRRFDEVSPYLLNGQRLSEENGNYRHPSSSGRRAIYLMHEPCQLPGRTSPRG